MARFEEGLLPDLGAVPDASFDAVLIVGLLMFLESRSDLAASRREIRRVLASSG